MQIKGHPRVFYIKCKPQKADIIELVLKIKRVFIGYPPWIRDMPYERHNLKKCIMDISVDEKDWQPNRIKNNYIRWINHNRNIATEVKPGDFVMVPRLDTGLVYIGRIKNTFELTNDPLWFEEYIELRRKQKLPITPLQSHIGDIVQCWQVDDFEKIVFPLIPRWLGSQLLNRTTIGWIKGAKAAQIVGQIYEQKWEGLPSNSGDIQGKLLDWVSPSMFEHMVCSLLQLEYPEYYWFHTGGSGDCGVDGMAIDKSGKIFALVQCKLQTNEDLAQIISELREKASRQWGTNVRIFGAILDRVHVNESKNIDILTREGIADLMIKHKGKYYGSKIFEGN